MKVQFHKILKEDLDLLKRNLNSVAVAAGNKGFCFGFVLGKNAYAVSIQVKD